MTLFAVTIRALALAGRCRDGEPTTERDFEAVISDAMKHLGDWQR